MLQPCVQEPDALQTPLWQSEAWVQALQSPVPVGAVPHSQVPSVQAEPAQSVGVVQKLPNERLHWPPVSQRPLWQSLSWVQAPQTAAPAGGLQSQVWSPTPPPLVQSAPLGQLAELEQAWVQVLVVVSQSWLTQSALELQVPQVVAGQLQ